LKMKKQHKIKKPKRCNRSDFFDPPTLLVKEPNFHIIKHSFLFSIIILFRLKSQIGKPIW
ncbi:hypothetical protein, partial [Pisciglobus halotolerans]|uniref:hypothetical protein n=1 Tax=Pisciglobus halotolerans TaxID=745365 RepID=UPI001C43298C